MTWKGPPPSESLPRPDAVASTAQRLLAEAAENVRDAGAAGSPVSTGELRDSWAVSGGGTKYTAAPTAKHAPYQTYDAAEIERVIAEADAKIGKTINALFGGN